MKNKKADLPYDEAADKIDPLSRYVNDEDIVQLKDDVPVPIMLVQRADLPYDEPADKIDPLSRYVNDEDIVQLHEENLVQLNRADLPYDEAADKIDPLSRYVNDEDIWIESISLQALQR